MNRRRELRLIVFAAALGTDGCHREATPPAGTTPVTAAVDASVASADALTVREAGVVEGGGDGEACKAFAATVCRLGKRMSGGRPYRCPIAGIDWTRLAVLVDRCRAGNAMLAGIEVMPPEMQAAIGSQVIVQVMGMPTLLEPTRDANRLLIAIELELKRRRSPDAYVDELRAVGPLACLTLVDRHRTAKGKLRRILRQLLVELQGSDLGDRADAWRDWCSEVVLGSVDLTSPGPAYAAPGAHWGKPPQLYYEESRWRIPASERRRERAHTRR